MRHTARALVIYNGQVLLMERWRQDDKSDDQLHYFSFPGGGIEEGESAPETVVREVEEEMGVMVKVNRLLAVQALPTEEHNYFWCEYISGEPRLRDDSIEAMRAKDGMNMYAPTWLPVGDLTAAMLHPVFRPVLPLLKDLAAGQIPSKVWRF